MSGIRIGIVGDWNPEFVSHVTNGPAVEHAAAAVGVPAEASWIASDAIDARDPAAALDPFDALWFTAGSPYRHRPGVLAALRYAREGGRPVLGTCAGFQYGLLEYAHNVLGRPELEHGEDAPDAPHQLITGVACAAPPRTAPGRTAPSRAADTPLLSGAHRIHIREDSKAREILKADRIAEEFHCSFELNPEYDELFEDSGLEFTGFGDHGESRIFEIPKHPFYIATLFQPQRASRPGAPHPLAVAFVEAAAATARVPRP